MRADAFEQDGILSLVFHELKDDTQIVARAARPRTGELALQLVRLELRMESVPGQRLKRQPEFRRELRMLAGKAAGRTDEGRGW